MENAGVKNEWNIAYGTKNYRGRICRSEKEMWHETAGVKSAGVENVAPNSRGGNAEVESAGADNWGSHCRIFNSCEFHPCSFHRIVFSTPVFLVDPLRLIY